MQRHKQIINKNNLTNKTVIKCHKCYKGNNNSKRITGNLLSYGNWKICDELLKETASTKKFRKSPNLPRRCSGSEKDLRRC